MRHFYFTVSSVLLLFFAILGTVVVTAFLRTSNNTGIDPAQIQEMRTFVAKQ